MNGIVNELFCRLTGSRTLHRCLTAMTGPYAGVFTLHRPMPEDGMFHGITESLLIDCLDFARGRGYEFVSIDELLRRALSDEKARRPMVCITLDDGYEDQLTRLLPILLKYDAKPTLFVISDFSDDLGWPWDAKLAYLIKVCPANTLTLDMFGRNSVFDMSSKDGRVHSRRAIIKHAKTLSSEKLFEFVSQVAAACGLEVPERAPEGYRPATWAMLREWEAKGLRVGSHNQSHNVLNALNAEKVGDELAHSWKRLHSELSSPSKVFCYPSGTAEDFSETHESLVQRAGYQAGITTLSQVAYFEDIRRNPYRISRIGFPNTVSQFARYASWVEALRSKLPV